MKSVSISLIVLVLSFSAHAQFKSERSLLVCGSRVDSHSVKLTLTYLPTQVPDDILSFTKLETQDDATRLQIIKETQTQEEDMLDEIKRIHSSKEFVQTGLGKPKKVQDCMTFVLATRENGRIKIDKNLFDKLPSKDQALLILDLAHDKTPEATFLIQEKINVIDKKLSLGIISMEDLLKKKDLCDEVTEKARALEKEKTELKLKLKSFDISETHQDQTEKYYMHVSKQKLISKTE